MSFGNTILLGSGPRQKKKAHEANRKNERDEREELIRRLMREAAATRGACVGLQRKFPQIRYGFGIVRRSGAV